MSKEYIEREAAKRALRIWITECVIDGDTESADRFRDCIDLLDSLDAADAAPVVRGEWTTLQQTCNGYGVMYYYHKECEVSGSEIHKRPFPYCPNCGAKMESEGST